MMRRSRCSRWPKPADVLGVGAGHGVGEGQPRGLELLEELGRDRDVDPGLGGGERLDAEGRGGLENQRFGTVGRGLSNGSVAAIEPGLRSTRAHGATPARHGVVAPLHFDARNPTVPSVPSTRRKPSRKASVDSQLERSSGRSLKRMMSWYVAQFSAEKLEESGDFTSRLAMFEELKTLPFAAVWDYYCQQAGVPVGAEWTGVRGAGRRAGAGGTPGRFLPCRAFLLLLLLFLLAVALGLDLLGPHRRFPFFPFFGCLGVHFLGACLQVRRGQFHAVARGRDSLFQHELVCFKVLRLAFADFDERSQLAMGNTWAVTRGLASPNQARAIVEHRISYRVASSLIKDMSPMVLAALIGPIVSIVAAGIRAGRIDLAEIDLLLNADGAEPMGARSIAGPRRVSLQLMLPLH